jgi:hypothetical protein
MSNIISLGRDWEVLTFAVTTAGKELTTTRPIKSFTIKNTSDYEIYFYRSVAKPTQFVIYPKEWHSFSIDFEGSNQDSGDSVSSFGFLKSEQGTVNIPVLITV